MDALQLLHLKVYGIWPRIISLSKVSIKINNNALETVPQIFVITNFCDAASAIVNIG